MFSLSKKRPRSRNERPWGHIKLGIAAQTWAAHHSDTKTMGAAPKQGENFDLGISDIPVEKVVNARSRRGAYYLRPMPPSIP